MFNTKRALRCLWIMSSLIVCLAMSMTVLAAPSTDSNPGKISVVDMTDFEAYPSGVKAQTSPLVPPLIMLVMSRDEQLFNKAYPDYTDLDGDGVIDTTYQNGFAYNGYFDPNLCYAYSATSNYYQAAAQASSHQCGTSTAPWSGNFLNWVAMSRLDIVRWVLYGGTRSTDTTTQTILERAEIPDDLHAWAKVYSGTDISKYTPFTAITTFCNVSNGTTGGWGALDTTHSGISSTPQIRAASGSWPDWASTAKLQCQWKGVGDGDSARPSSASTVYTARISVCRGGSLNEAFCVAYGTNFKPEGLLQKYSKNDSNVKRFGLVTGSSSVARLGGQLRRNVGPLAYNVPGTACASGNAGNGDEFNSSDGTFCYKSASSVPTEGIVKTLDRLQVVGWNGTDYGTSKSTDCYNTDTGNAWGARGYMIAGTGTPAARCPDFGNPLASMYAEALRYIQGSSGATYTDTGSILPLPTWADPYGTKSDGKQRNQPCASCSIVLISSGLNTFDAANVPSVTTLDAAGLTNSVKSGEGIAGQYLLSTYYNNSSLSGAPANGTLTAAGTSFSDIAICSPTSIGTLSSLAGVCLGAPGQQGGYLIAGLSYGAWTQSIRTTNVDKGFHVKTYGISLSDNLPSFSIAVGSQTVAISPSCRASPAVSGGKSIFNTCYIGNVRIGAQSAYAGNGYTSYGLTPTTTYPNVGSYYFVWEDSQYGSDHDQDANNVISWCVGSSCNMPSAVNSGGVAICDPVVMNGNVLKVWDSVQKKQVASHAVGGACTSAGKLSFTPGSNDIVVRNQLVAYSSGDMYLGFQVSGTSNDGLTEFFIGNGGTTDGTSASNGANFNCVLLGNSSGNTNSNSSGTGCDSNPQVTSFKLGTTTAVTTLQPPLWYAAKYSGFNGSSPPTLLAGKDPDNYFFARNAGGLKTQLDAVFQSITSEAANNFGNASPAIAGNDIKGNGLAYQVQYFQQRNGVNWVGSLQALWTDDNGYLREGTTSGSNQILSTSAKYVTSGPDTTPNALPGAMATYRCDAAPTSTDMKGCSQVSATNPLQPAWDASALLNAYYDPTQTNDKAAIGNLTVQRDYANAGSTGQRYIFTYLTEKPNGSSSNGTVTSGTQTDFVWNDASCPSGTTTVPTTATSGFCGSFDTKTSTRRGNYGWLNEKDPGLAQKLLGWVRGVEDQTNFRSRTSSSTTNRATYRLGDIIDSSPVVVGTPSESYDLLYNDFSYSAFRSNFRNRRQMVYTGANDGMLHAFNGGFYTTGQASTGTPPTLQRTLPSGLASGDPKNASGNNWALGQEVWAFIPQNLLPHLRWLAQKDYSHVFYVDGSPVVSDVRLWGAGDSEGCKSGTPATSDIDAHGHVCGWGTLMVVPFRLGGGAISVDTVGSGTDTDVQTSNSAYVILDITDPEKVPTVLGEITTGTYTTSAPAFAVHKTAKGVLQFLLTIGSGPADNGGANGFKPVSAPAGSNLGVWVYDLATVLTGSSDAVATLTGTAGGGPAASFAGDMVASDFDLNNSAEAVYFGVVTNPPPAANPPDPSKNVYGGGLWKLDLRSDSPSSWSLKQIIDVGVPVSIRPVVGLDASQRPMIYFGSGRSFTADDDSGSTYQGVQKQYIVGVSDNSLLANLAASCQVLPITKSNLVDVTNTVVSADGTITAAGVKQTGVSTFGQLRTAMMAKATNGCYQYSGWIMSLTEGNMAANVQQPSERVVSSQILFGGLLLTPTYIPPSLQAKTDAGSSDCNPIPVSGISYLYGLNYLTGTADPGFANYFGTHGDKPGIVSKSITLGSGKSSAPYLHLGNGINGGKTAKACMQLGGQVICKDIPALGAVTSGEISWREPVDNQ
ncbi:MAG: PilC/PilY family type IV pilus protein [Rhodanobacter sp.]